MYPVSNKELNKEDDEAVYFFTTAFQPLDNFSAHALALWGREFPTAEHAYHWKKFSQVRPDLAKKVLTAKSAHAAKEVSVANKVDLPLQWREERILMMEEILRAKAEQHEDVRAILKKTGRRTIIENSPVDGFWGIGPDGKGQNMVGKIWMKIRDSLT